MYVSKSLKSVFVHIPKTGGTALKSQLLNNLDFTRHSKKHGWLGLLESEYDDYSAFALIRNPYWRVLSQYRFFYLRLEYMRVVPEHLKQWRQRFDMYRTFDADGFYGFLSINREFYLTRKNFVPQDQAGYLEHKTIQPVIFRYEEGLQNTADKIAEMLGLPKVVLQKNDGVHYLGDYRLEDFYDERSIEFVNEFYKRDFEQYGYEML